MRRTDVIKKEHFRSSDRFFRQNGQWYFQTRGGDRGPFGTREEAELDLKRYVDTMEFIDDIKPSLRADVAMTDDRRRHKRIDVIAGLIADDGIWAVNLSEMGMGLWSRTAFEPDATIAITLALPSCKQKVSARVVWCQRARSISDQGFLVGVTFVALSRATQRAIKAYIAECPEIGICLKPLLGRSG